jgi:uncharacterized protein
MAANFIDPQKPSTWKRYQKGMCDGCWGGCCTLPLEASAYDLIRLKLITEDEAASSLKKVSKRLIKEGWVRSFHPATGLFMMEQKYGDRGIFECIFLGPDRLCTVYARRPEVCRQFPKIGPKPGFCPAFPKAKSK